MMGRRARNTGRFAGLVALVALAIALARHVPTLRAPLPDPASDAGAPRLVVLSPAIAITLRDLGLAGHIVGRHAYDLALDRSIPVCGDQQGIDYESLIRARPTHVLLEWGSRPLPPHLLSLARERGWTLLDDDLLTLDQIRESIRTLPGELGLDTPSALARSRELLDRARAAWSPLRGAEKLGRTIVLLPGRPPAAMGPGSFHQQILERLGVPLAIREGGPYIELDAEDLLRIRPGAMLLLAPRPVGAPRAPEARWEDIERALGGLATLDVPAIRDRRVAVLDHPLALTGSSAMIDLAERVRAVFREWMERDAGAG